MSVYAVGNGNVCAYMNGADIEQIFGPTYSSPIALSMYAAKNIFTSTYRESLGVWCSKGENVTVYDYADTDEAIFYRKVKSNCPINFTLYAKNTDKLFRIPENLKTDGIMCITYEGEVIYSYEVTKEKNHGYVSSTKRYFGLSTYGEITVEITGTLKVNKSSKNGQ